MGYEKDISYDLIKSALRQKIHVVTGNKAMLAKHGYELFKIAEENKVLLAFEAAVAGGIPIIKTIKNEKGPIDFFDSNAEKSWLF